MERTGLPVSRTRSARVPFAAGAVWSALLAAAVMSLPAQTGPSGSAIVVTFLLLAAVAGSAIHLVTTGTARSLGISQWPKALDGVQSLLLGSWIGLSALSLVKFRATRSPLGWDDVRFLARSGSQVVAEATRRESAFLALSLTLPILLGAIVYRLLRSETRVDPPRLARSALWLLVSVVLLLAWRGLEPRGFSTLTRADPLWAGFAKLRDGSALREANSVDEQSLALSLGPPIRAYVSAPDFRRANVVVVMLESVPWSRLLGPDARPEATPRLLALASDSAVFSRAYATATHSDYAQTSILASLHPRKFDHHDFFTDLAYPRTLIWDLFRPLGYRTAVFSCQNESWGNMQAFLRSPGLEIFRHAPDWPHAPRRGEGAESKVFESTPVDAFLEWLNESPRTPFVTYLNFQATHYPYVIPAGEPQPFQPSDIDFPTTFLSYPLEKIPVMENRFHNALAYVDRQFGRLVDGLIAADAWNETVVLVVSDHGEAFYEHGIPTHGTTLHEEQVRTTMFLRLPGEAPREIPAPVSVLDAVPTIVSFLGLPEHGNFQGRDDVLQRTYLESAHRGRAIPFTIQGMTREDGLLLDDWKLIVHRDRREYALFDLAVDPGERRNLAAMQPEKAAIAAKELQRVLGLQLAYYRERGWEKGHYAPRLP